MSVIVRSENGFVLEEYSLSSMVIAVGVSRRTDVRTVRKRERGKRGTFMRVTCYSGEKRGPIKV